MHDTDTDKRAKLERIAITSGVINSLLGLCLLTGHPWTGPAYIASILIHAMNVIRYFKEDMRIARAVQAERQEQRKQEFLAKVRA